VPQSTKLATERPCVVSVSPISGDEIRACGMRNILSAFGGVYDDDVLSFGVQLMAGSG